MNTEAVLTTILPIVTQRIKTMVEEAAGRESAPTLYELEVLTQAVLPQIGHAILQGLVTGQGTGVRGPECPCACGAEQCYQDQGHSLTIQTSVGLLRLRRRASYHCTGCGANSYPLDAQLGLKHAGRMSRYLQDQCGWLLALLPARVAQQTLVRFGWPAVSASQIREHGEALGAEMEQQEAERLKAARQETGRCPAQQTLPRQPAQQQRLYAAPDGVMYCTTGRDPTTGKAQWRELKVAAVYEAEPEPAKPSNGEETKRPEHEPVRVRLARWLSQYSQVAPASADRAVRVTYVAETGPWESFGARLWAELWARGLTRPVRDLAVVADGSDHIDQVVDNELRIPEVRVTRILDLAHAQQHLWAVSKAAFGEGSAAGRAWVQAPLAALERGQQARLLEGLEALALEREQTVPSVAEMVRKAMAYFVQRREQVDYPRFVMHGYQIGSGLAESACKRFGTDRMKGAGMRWTVAGAQAVATLRMLVLSERWREVSAHCRKVA